MIPISRVSIGEAEEEEVLEVLRSGHLAQGPKVAALEEHCAKMAGSNHAVAVNNGTTALVLAVEALGIGPGDEVITSPFTFVATVNAILEAGATVRFGDIGDDFNLDPESVLPLIGPNTKAIMPVHLYGQCADMAAFNTIADSHGLFLIEDAAQAHGARTHEGAPAGSTGVGCFSFYATKNVMCGEGGVVTTSDAGLAERMRILRNQGMKQRYEYVAAGHNYRMTDLSAAVALPQFDRLDAMINARGVNAAVLAEGLEGIEGVRVPSVIGRRRHVWHQFTLEVTPGAAIGRDGLAAALDGAGVGWGFYYPKAVYDYECYRTHPRVVIEGSPRAEAAAASVISLPVHGDLRDGDLSKIVGAVRSAFGVDELSSANSLVQVAR